VAVDRVVLRDTRDGSGSRFLEAILDSDGTLRIEGQDLGRGVSAVFGSDLSEYEWWWRLPAAHVDEAIATLGGAPGELILTVVERWSKANNGLDPGSALKAAGLPIAFDSRIGD
jgi:hypothetical protein